MSMLKYSRLNVVMNGLYAHLNDMLSDRPGFKMYLCLTELAWCNGTNQKSGKIVNPVHFWGSQVVYWSKALHLSARSVTTDPGLIPDCITTGCDWESHRVAHNWPSIVRVRVWPG